MTIPLSTYICYPYGHRGYSWRQSKNAPFSSTHLHSSAFRANTKPTCPPYFTRLYESLTELRGYLGNDAPTELRSSPSCARPSGVFGAPTLAVCTLCPRLKLTKQVLGLSRRQCTSNLRNQQSLSVVGRSSKTPSAKCKRFPNQVAPSRSGICVVWVYSRVLVRRRNSTDV